MIAAAKGDAPPRPSFYSVSESLRALPSLLRVDGSCCWWYYYFWKITKAWEAWKYDSGFRIRGRIPLWQLFFSSKKFPKLIWWTFCKCLSMPPDLFNIRWFSLHIVRRMRPLLCCSIILVLQFWKGFAEPFYRDASMTRCRKRHCLGWMEFGERSCCPSSCWTYCHQ